MAISIDRDDDEIISTINTTPLVDVMLVLLIIFLITVPVVTRSIPVKLPQTENHLNISKPDTVVITVTATGSLHLNGSDPIKETEWVAALTSLTQQKSSIKIEIRGDKNVKFSHINRVLNTVKSLGISDVGFAIEPSTP
jgi:biopolymer transport protein ExbD